MSLLAGSVPILSCDEARALESKLFGGDETLEWAAMKQAGRSIARALLRDSGEIGGLTPSARLLVLAGKGHNGGDALIAAGAILEALPSARADVLFVFGERALRPLAARAWRELQHRCGGRVRTIARLDDTSEGDCLGNEAPSAEAERVVPSALSAGSRRSQTSALGTTRSTFKPGCSVGYDVALDGVFGFQFRPPVEPSVAELINRVNARPVRLRAAVDLPSGGLFRADFTYATGSVKAPVVAAPEAGRVRYLDLGFFNGEVPGAARVLTRQVIARLAGLRAPSSDKRSYGHLFVVGGSRDFPGAVLMTVLAALQSGVGLVTAFVPESIVGAFAARAPEAMWVGWPETPTGGLALEGEHLLGSRLERANALVIGPGLGRESETLALAASIARSVAVPLVIDADALRPEITGAGHAPRIVTPHAGEFARISGGDELGAFARRTKATAVLKGPVTRVADGDTIYHSFFGGPVLARGGSGDLLAGLIGGLLAQQPSDALRAAARGVVWHGLAADELARARGQTPVRVTQLLDFLPAALRASVDEIEPGSAGCRAVRL
jgi:ADP-dependent NAD(P)H-hydrate dehydratase / NAD(P)H-hydrate epimerase